jgi:hypothetical protein
MGEDERAEAWPTIHEATPPGRYGGFESLTAHHLPSVKTAPGRSRSEAERLRVRSPFT